MLKGLLWKQYCKTFKNHLFCNYLCYDFSFSSGRGSLTVQKEYLCLVKIIANFLRSNHNLRFRPRVKTPPQDTLLKLEKDQTLNELSVESSLFAFKLGLAKLKCSLLMNGLVYEPNEVHIEPYLNTLFRYFFKTHLGWLVGVEHYGGCCLVHIPRGCVTCIYLW